MPYVIRKNKRKGGFDIIRKDDGVVVGHSTTLQDARGSIYHREHGEKKK